MYNESNISFNLNDSVKIKLNPIGIQIINDYYNEVPYFAKQNWTVTKYIDNEGYYKLQFWNFMNIFGDYMVLGNDNIPFDLNIILIK